MSLSSLTIKARLLASLFVTLLMTAGAALTGYWGISNLGAFSIEVLHGDVETWQLATNLRTDVLELRRYEKDVFINIADGAKTRSYRAQWRDVLASAQGELERIAEHDSEFESQTREMARSLETYAGGFERIYSRIDAREIVSTAQANEAMTQYKEPIRRSEELAAQIAQGAKDKASQAEAAVGEKQRSVALVLLLLSVVGLTVAGALARSLVRAVTDPLAASVAIAADVAAGKLGRVQTTHRRDEFGRLLGALREMDVRLHSMIGSVRDTAHHVDVASAEIAAGNDDLSRRTQEQAASLEETAASIEQITAAVQRNAANAGEAGELARNAAQTAEQGGAVVREVVDSMRTIKEASDRIATIVGVIDDIAFQTNLLALNAAVEAARAGDQGRGFAVVASEVRSLAQRSAAAAREIKSMIGDSVVKVGEGSQLAARAGDALEQIVVSVKKVATVVESISSANAEQAAGVEQINQAIGRLDDMTQHNAAAVEQIAASSKSLQQHATTLSHQTRQFTLHGAVDASVSGAQDERGGAAAPSDEMTTQMTLSARAA